MSAQDTLALVLLGAALLVLVTLPPVHRPAGWPSLKHIADRVMLWSIGIMIAIALSIVSLGRGVST